ncbi:rhodanese-like domain-containing protein [Sandaracinomonas limnophila]|uniref:Rhodanese-like domain-containing protein n=1 Tax=Sandaracinomonas limnophila TaxID=1862386 RepID=A0A437PXN2_9BACT|nr:rhodanese-like domain-containing protein [Sandaracinomonas limnophila]RVU27024.1 rhodanese-like domain-containing protein [Sandaracinomonas limnophila]
MLNLLKNLLGMGPKVDLKELMKNGAQIIDVRTPSEFAGGHLKGAINLPLQTLGNNLSKIKKDKPVITCCASGMRSSAAKRLLKSNGFDAHNGGAWLSLK